MEYMNWKVLTEVSQLEEIDDFSNEKTQLIFKHSTRCIISKMALQNFERSFNSDNVDCYLLDLIKFREISNQIASRYQITHESPQLLVIKEGKVIYHESHEGINATEVERIL